MPMAIVSWAEGSVQAVQSNHHLRARSEAARRNKACLATARDLLYPTCRMPRHHQSATSLPGHLRRTHSAHSAHTVPPSTSTRMPPHALPSPPPPDAYLPSHSLLTRPRACAGPTVAMARSRFEGDDSCRRPRGVPGCRASWRRPLQLAAERKRTGGGDEPFLAAVCFTSSRGTALAL